LLIISKRSTYFLIICHREQAKEVNAVRASLEEMKNIKDQIEVTYKNVNQSLINILQRLDKSTSENNEHKEKMIEKNKEYVHYSLNKIIRKNWLINSINYKWKSPSFNLN
jgi:hypothetical protein